MSWKQFAREHLRTAAGRWSNIHIKGKRPDIVVLSSPRSGSTWVMDILGAETGMKPIDEPLMKPRVDAHKLLKAATKWRYGSIDAESGRALREYLTSDWRTRPFAPAGPLSRNYRPFTNRRVLKIIRATPLVEWFASETDFQVVYLIRHPVPQATSCIQRGHDSRLALNAFLSDEAFVDRHLHGKRGEWAARAAREGTEFERFITIWCMENLVALGVDAPTRQDRWLPLSYEETVLAPERIAERLASTLQLSNPRALLAAVDKPSKVTNSSSSETVQRIRQGDRNYLIKKWAKHATLAQTAAAQEILDVFDVSLYRVDQFLPRESWLHFPPHSLESAASQIDPADEFARSET